MAKIMRNTFPELKDLAEVINADRTARVSTNVHRDAGEYTITFATLSGTGTTNENLAIAATNECMYKYLLHVKDVYNVIAAADGSIGVAHKGAWPVEAFVKATDLATAYTLANLLKSDGNLHFDDTDAHDNADAATAIAAADATTLASLQTLVNELKGDFNAHFALALGGKSIRLVPA
jgi:hypothetical protein